MRYLIIFFCAVLCALALSVTQAEVPKLINYQGKLTTPQGALVDTTVSMQFSIYSDSTGGDPLWSETQPSVKVDKGIFNVLLGSVNEIPESAFSGSIRYLGVKVADDPEMTPRRQIVSVGYAYKANSSNQADNADKLGGKPSGDFFRFIYQDSDEKQTWLFSTWQTLKSFVIPANTVTSKILVYYDVTSDGSPSDASGWASARVTINGVSVDSISASAFGRGYAHVSGSKFRSIVLDVDNSAPLSISLDLACGSPEFVAKNMSFLILGN